MPATYSAPLSKLKTTILKSIDQHFNLYLTLTYAILGLIGILNHAMWRDEINVWLIARDSPDLATLYTNVRYEGHPLLWYLCLFALNRITANPVAMQLFHWLIGVAIASLFTFGSPFSRLYKALFIFGYFCFYEFLFLSRNYSIGILFLFIFCLLFPHRKSSYIPLGICLFLLANTNAFALFLCLALGIMLIVEYCCETQLRAGRWQQLGNRQVWDACLGLGLWLLGLYASLQLLIPPGDAKLAGGWDFNLQFEWGRLFQTLSIVWKAYIPILKPADRDVLPFGLVSIGIWCWFSSFLIRKPYLLLLNSLGTAIILSFCYVKFIGSERHHAHIFFLAITCLWLAPHFPDQMGLESRLLQWQRSLHTFIQSVLRPILRFFQRYQQPFWTFVLIAHCLAGLAAYGRDLVLPYSASRATAAFIQDHHLNQLLIVGSRDFAVSPLAGYLNRKIYYPEIQAQGSFVLFRQSRQERDLQAVLAQLTELVKEHPQILLILTPELKPETLQAPPQLKIMAIATFTHSLIGNEKYYLYRVQPASDVA